MIITIIVVKCGSVPQSAVFFDNVFCYNDVLVDFYLDVSGTGLWRSAGTKGRSIVDKLSLL